MQWCEKSCVLTLETAAGVWDGNFKAIFINYKIFNNNLEVSTQNLIFFSKAGLDRICKVLVRANL